MYREKDTQQKTKKMPTADELGMEKPSPTGFWSAEDEGANSTFEDPSRVYPREAFCGDSGAKGSVKVSKDTPAPAQLKVKDVPIWRDDNLAASGNHPNFSKPTYGE